MTLGYSKGDIIKEYSLPEIDACLKLSDLSTEHLYDGENPSAEAQCLVEYFKYRAHLLINIAQKNLMTREQAKIEFEKIQSSNKNILVPFNKQSGEKRHIAYLTAIVNTLTQQVLADLHFNDDPRKLVVTTKNSKLVKTLSRRVDGAFPDTTNPIALWEIKEYYGTTTFGSRVADGVYETILDGYELRELEDECGIKIKHYLIVDDYFTWWKCGKSYLCRLVDIMHEGLVDELLIGREVVTRWPAIVSTWLEESPRK